jgi:hypothetical protein
VALLSLVGNNGAALRVEDGNRNKRQPQLNEFALASESPMGQ